MKNHKCKILIIDDEEELCDMLSLRLSCLGFETDYSYNGEKGLEKIKSFQPNIVVLDVIMPGMDGWEVCKKIKENEDTKEIKVVLLTATQGKYDLNEKARSVGAEMAFLKPVGEEKLVKTLCDLC